MNKTIQIDKSRNRQHQPSRQSNPPLAPQSKLPPIRRSLDHRRGSIQSNYTTLPVPNETKVSRYMEEQSEGANPYGSRAASPIDFQVTRYVNKSRKRTKKQTLSLNSARTRQKRQQQQKKTIYYADSRSKVKNSSFHWNIGTPRNFNANISTTRVNE